MVRAVTQVTGLPNIVRGDSCYHAGENRIVHLAELNNVGISIIAGEINADGTVTYGTPQVLRSGSNLECGTVIYNPAANCVVATYGIAGGGVVYCRAMTLSDKAFTLGTEVSLDAGATYPSLVYDPGNECVVATFKDEPSDYLVARALTVSGTTITFGTKVTLIAETVSADSGMYNAVITADGVILRGFQRSPYQDVELVAFTVTGTTINAGATTMVRDGVTGDTRFGLRMAYDPITGKVVAVTRRQLPSTNHVAFLIDVTDKDTISVSSNNAAVPFTGGATSDNAHMLVAGNGSIGHLHSNLTVDNVRFQLIDPSTDPVGVADYDDIWTSSDGVNPFLPYTGTFDPDNKFLVLLVKSSTDTYVLVTDSLPEVTGGGGGGGGSNYWSSPAAARPLAARSAAAVPLGARRSEAA